MGFSRQEYWSGCHLLLQGNLSGPGIKPMSSVSPWIAGRFFTHWAIGEAQICQFSSVAQSCLTLYNPMDCSRPGFPVHHQLLEFTQTHVHWVSDAIQPSYPIVIPFSSCLQSFPASGSFQMSQFFASGGQSIGVSASSPVLPMNIQGWFPWCRASPIIYQLLHHYICNIMMYQISTPALNVSTGSTEGVSVFSQWMIQSSQPCLSRVVGATRIRYTIFLLLELTLHYALDVMLFWTCYFSSLW